MTKLDGKRVLLQQIPASPGNEHKTSSSSVFAYFEKSSFRPFLALLEETGLRSGQTGQSRAEFIRHPGDQFSGEPEIMTIVDTNSTRRISKCPSALNALHVLATAVSAVFKSRAALHLENLALRHQLCVLRRSVKRPKLTVADRLLLGVLVLGRLLETVDH